MNSNKLWDCHMHSSFSGDCEIPMETMIRQAISLGLPGICITEHFDPDYPEIPDPVDFNLDIPSYKNTLFSLKEQYKNQIQIHYGIELGLQPHLADFFHDLLASESFDYVIGSSHVVYGKDPYYPEFFENRSEEESFLAYFESVLGNLQAFSEMDSYGHLDYIVRYSPNKAKNFSLAKYQDIIDEILHTMIQKDVALEVNAGGFAYGLGQPNPCAEIITEYLRLGGEYITIGADAHKPERIGYAFDRLPGFLASCGVKEYTVFQNRKPFKSPLDSKQ